MPCHTYTNSAGTLNFSTMRLPSVWVLRGDDGYRFHVASLVQTSDLAQLINSHGT